MSGEIKKPDFLKTYALPSLPENRADVVVLGEGPVVIPTRYVLDETALRSLEQRSTETLQQSLGVLRKRIVSDLEGEDAQETMESYWARLESTTLSDVLQAESREWREHLKGENTALERVACRAYYRIVQHKAYLMGESELARGSDGLLARIGQDDLDLSREALAIYKGFVETFFLKRSDLLAYEVVTFRIMVREKIQNALSGDQAGDVDAGMIFHLNDLLQVYAKIASYDGIFTWEIQDGTKWMEAYMQGGHVLEQRAKKVHASLPVASTKVVDQGNELPDTQGVIDATQDSISTGIGEVPEQDAPKVMLNVWYGLNLIGAKFKPVK